MALSRESIALRKSNTVFKRAVDPDNLITVLYSNLLLTHEEKLNATQRTLTDDQKLEEVFTAMERRVSVTPGAFHKLVEVLRDEPALKAVGDKIQGYYDEESQHAAASRPQHVDTSSLPDLPRAKSTTQPPNSPELHGIAVAPSEKTRRVAEEASQLEMHFLAVLTDTEVQFSKKAAESDGFLNKFYVTLTTLPFSHKFQRLKFLIAEKQRLRIAKDVHEIFDVLKPYLKYTNYSLLQHIIQKFGGQKLKQEMEKYVTALEEFEKRVSVDDIQSVSFKRELPCNFKPMQFKIERNSSSCSLYGVRKIREAITNEAALEPYVDILVGVFPSSVTITVAFPSRALALVASSMSSAFLKSHKILSVSLDSKPLEVYIEQGKKLYRASEMGDMATVTSLLQNGADVNFVDGFFQKAVLQCASESDRRETVQLLLEKGADPNAQDKGQETPLHRASGRDDRETLQLLLEKGADPNVQDIYHQKTALHYASEKGHREIVQLLLEKGADPNVQDIWGRKAGDIKPRQRTSQVQAMAWEGEHRRIVVTGKVGIGKSTLINNYLGLDVTTDEGAEFSDMKADRTTKEVKSYCKSGKEFRGEKWDVYDTPGWSDSDHDNFSHIDILCNIYRQTKGDVDVLYYCFSARYDIEEEDIDTFKLLTTIFGQNIWKYTVFVMTFANDINLDVEEYHTKIKKYEEDIKNGLKKANVSEDIVSKTTIVSAGDESFHIFQLKGNWKDHLFEESSRRMSPYSPQQRLKVVWTDADEKALNDKRSQLKFSFKSILGRTFRLESGNRARTRAEPRLQLNLAQAKK